MEEGRGMSNHRGFAGMLPGLDINTRVVLFHLGLPYPSLVQDMEHGGIWLGMPVISGVSIIPAPGEPLEVAYPTSGGKYAFHSQVRRVRLKEPLLLLASWPQAVDRTQDREFFRLPVSLPVSWRFPGTRDWVEGVTHNLSAGGALVRADIQLGITLDFKMKLRGGWVQIRARTVRKEAGGTALEFVRIRGEEQDAITAFLFREQRERRKRGLL